MAWCLCLEGKHVDIRLPTKILFIVFVLCSLSPFYGLSPLPLREVYQSAFTMASYTLGSAVSRSISCSNPTDSGEDAKESGRRESEKFAKRGRGAGKRKKEGRESLRRPSFSQFPPFLFSCLYRCSFVLSCEHVL